MIAVGLTGGIGSGKSTLAALLAARGAVVVDADVLARRAVEPGGPAHRAVVERFGRGVLSPDGNVDRPALAAVVFADAAARSDLNAIVHPAVRELAAADLAAHAGTDAVVVVQVPLLVESGGAGLDLAKVVVVDCPEDVALRRLVDQRGMAEGDARARMAVQATRRERLAAADLVVDNSAGLDALAAEADRCWAWLRGLPHAG